MTRWSGFAPNVAPPSLFCNPEGGFRFPLGAVTGSRERPRAAAASPPCRQRPDSPLDRAGRSPFPRPLQEIPRAPRRPPIRLLTRNTSSLLRLVSRFGPLSVRAILGLSPVLESHTAAQLEFPDVPSFISLSPVSSTISATSPCYPGSMPPPPRLRIAVLPVIDNFPRYTSLRCSACSPISRYHPSPLPPHCSSPL